MSDVVPYGMRHSKPILTGLFVGKYAPVSPSIRTFSVSTVLKK